MSDVRIQALVAGAGTRDLNLLISGVAWLDTRFSGCLFLAWPAPGRFRRRRLLGREARDMETNHPPVPAIQLIPLEPGKHYTVYAVSDSAMTIRREIRLIEAFPSPEFRPAYLNAAKGKWRFGTFKEGRKRTTYYLDLHAPGTLIIPGVLHGVAADHEKWTSFAMSATLNLAATPERIRELVALNVNPNFSRHDTLIAYPEPLKHGGGDNGILVYPDAPTSHAVIRRMRESLDKEGA